MRAKRIRFSDQDHKRSSFSDTKQVIGKPEAEGKFAQ